MISKPDLKVTVTVLFNVKYLANGTRWSYSYNGGLIECHTWSTEPRHFQCIFNDLEQPQTQISRSGHSLKLNIPEMAKDTAVVTIEGE